MNKKSTLPEIKKLLKLRGKEPQIPKYGQIIGDLYVANGDIYEGIKFYLESASLYEKIKEPYKAIAIYRKILKLNPQNYETYNKIGELLTKMGLIGDAKLCYLSLAKLYYNGEKYLDAMNTLDKILIIDPDNIEALNTSANIAIKENMNYIGAQKLFKIGDIYYKNAVLDRAISYYKKGLMFEPDEEWVVNRIDEIRSITNIKNENNILEDNIEKIFEKVGNDILDKRLEKSEKVEIIGIDQITSKRNSTIYLSVAFLIIVISIIITIKIFKKNEVEKPFVKNIPITKKETPVLNKKTYIPEARSIKEELEVIWRNNTRFNTLIKATLITPKNIEILNKIESEEKKWDKEREEKELKNKLKIFNKFDKSYYFLIEILNKGEKIDINSIKEFLLLVNDSKVIKGDFMENLPHDKDKGIFYLKFRAKEDLKELCLSFRYKNREEVLKWDISKGY